MNATLFRRPVLAMAAALLAVSAIGSTMSPAFASPSTDIAADGIISIQEVRDSTTGELVQAMKQISGAKSVSMAGGKAAVLAELEAAGADRLEVPELIPGSESMAAEAASLQPAAITLGIVEDVKRWGSSANISYRRGLGGMATLTVCRDWAYTGYNCRSGVGTLSTGQNAKTKYGWSDTDGYYSPTGYRTVVTWGTSAYSFIGAGWVKTPGRAGGTWAVTGMAK